jgi:ParB-like chromosome segregation protein Spo0J
MKIDFMLVNELRPYPNNARTHSKKQIRQIATSIKKFGFCNPVLIDDTKQIIAGHGRVEAAKLLGIDAVPTCRLSHLSEADKRAYVLADNKLAEEAGWDKKLLAIELQGLIDLDVEIELTGFELPEIDLILEDAREATEAFSGLEDRVPQDPSSAVVTRPKAASTKPAELTTKPPTNPNAKKLVSLRIDWDILDHFQEAGPGWQARINETLRKAIGK